MGDASLLRCGSYSSYNPELLPRRITLHTRPPLLPHLFMPPRHGPRGAPLHEARGLPHAQPQTCSFQGLAAPRQPPRLPALGRTKCVSSRAPSASAPQPACLPALVTTSGLRLSASRCRCKATSKAPALRYSGLFHLRRELALYLASCACGVGRLLAERQGRQGTVEKLIENLHA